MRKQLLLFGLILLNSVLFAQDFDFKSLEKIVNSDQQKFSKKSAFTESPSYSETDLVYQRMEWSIDPAVRYIRGKVTSYFISKTGNLQQIEFELSNKLTVDSIVQRNHKIDFTHAENKINISFPAPLVVHQLDSVTIYYAGVPDNEGDGFGTFVTATQPDETPILWTLSEPYGARLWWPCKQSLTDKIDSIDVIVSTPEKYKTASNGVLVSNRVENQLRTMHWKHRHPIVTYLVAIAVTDYAVYSDYLTVNDSTQIEILNYVFPAYLEQRKEQTKITADVMEYFNQTIGEYPFANEKYGHAEFGWGGGMEHQTMSFMGSFSFHLITHELAHQWFGDYITLGTWQDIWLNEGFATYLTGLAYGGVLKENWWYLWKKSTVERIVSAPDGSVFVADTTDISRIFNGRLSYSKGAYLLHMIRGIIGDQAFFTGLKNYYNDPEIANGFAYTRQLKKHMENAGDTTLTEFFNDWFFGEGYPEYSLDFTVSGSNEVVLQLSQKPTHSSVDFFEMPVPLRLYNATKTDSADFKVIHTHNNQQFTLQAGFQVADIKIDPEYDLVSKTTKVSFVPSFGNQNKIFVFPNPVNDKLKLVLPNDEHLISMKIFSVNGRLIETFTGENTTYNLAHLAKGTYLIQVQTNREIHQQQIVKL